VITIIIRDSKIFKDINFISKLKGENCLKHLKTKYKDFDIVLKDFVETVLLKNSTNTEIIFINEIKKLNYKSNNMKNKLLRVANNFLVYEKNVLLTCHPDDINIDYEKYYKEEIRYNRNMKLKRLN
jgi:hypothetical protein